LETPRTTRIGAQEERPAIVGAACPAIAAVHSIGVATMCQKYGIYS